MEIKCKRQMSKSEVFSGLRQTWAGYFEWDGEVQSSWTWRGMFDIYFCVFLDCYRQSLISGEKNGR